MSWLFRIIPSPFKVLPLLIVNSYYISVPLVSNKGYGCNWTSENIHCDCRHILKKRKQPFPCCSYLLKVNPETSCGHYIWWSTCLLHYSHSRVFINENNSYNKKSLNILKLVIRIRKSKDRQSNGQKKKGQTTIYKTLHINLNYA